MNKKVMLRLSSFVTLASCLASMCDASAQTKPPPATQSTEAIPSGDSANDEGKSLDELLGIEDEAESEPDSKAADAAARENQEELDRELNEAKIADGFTQAIEKMSLSADLLDMQFDPGLGTQRVQEDILARLASLIDQSKKSKSRSSSRSQSSSQQQQAKNQQNKPGPQQSKPTPPGSQRNNKPSDSQEGDAPPMQEGDINTVLEESGAEWGSLPQRVRDALIQGKRDKYSRLYDQLTAEYYKRLAEENAP